MSDKEPSPLGNVITIDDERIKSRPNRIVRVSVEEGVERLAGGALSYYSWLEEHCRRIRTSNPLERVLREIRQRTGVGWRFSGRPIGSQPGHSTLAAHRRDRLVDRGRLEH